MGETALIAPPDNMLETSEFRGVGYTPIVRYGAWRVAVLNYIDELEPHRINTVQKHNETDEVFVLLRGRCMLFLLEAVGSAFGKVYAIDMEPLRAYNIKKGTWHTHTLPQGSSVLIVEDDATSSANSPVLVPNAEVRAEFVRLARPLYRKEATEQAQRAG